MSGIWPGDTQCVAMLTFDVDGVSSWIRRNPDFAKLPSLMSMAEYGPSVAMPRILDLLDAHSIQASFYVPGYVAETHVELVEDMGHVEVTLICNESGNLVLSVTDDGCGFDSDDMADSQGLAMMNDYAKAIGGQTEINSASERGTTVSLSLPPEASKPILLVPGVIGETQFPTI